MPQEGPRTGLAYLPTELYDVIVAYLERDADDYRLFRKSLLALSRAIPRAPLSLELLFRRIILHSPAQARRLLARLDRDSGLAELVNTFTYECFDADPDVIAGLLNKLQSVTDLTLFMGPSFTPEHLEELFASPRTILKSLSLRFRPYVKKASYLQFMKGVYFDSTLTYLSTWPRSSLPKLSIVQDPLDPSIAQKDKFAQPIVFFRLDPISVLSASSFATSLTSLRFRIPFRHIVPHLHKYQQSLPQIKFLDIATCSITEAEFEALLVDSKQIHTLILDGCPLVSQRRDALEVAGAQVLEQWTSLGKTLALVGVKRAREREKKIKGWIEQQESGKAVRRSNVGGSRKAKKGRKGIANATFMIRDSTWEETKAIEMPQVVTTAASSKGKGRADQSPGVVSNKGSSGELKLAKSNAAASKADGSSSRSRSSKKKRPKAFRITPSPSSVRSLAITAPMVSINGNDFKEKYAAVRAAFEAGWSSGVRQLTMARDRLRTTWHTGSTRILIDTTYHPRFSEWQENPSPPDVDDSSQGDTSSDSFSSGMSSEELDRRLIFKEQLKYLMKGLKEATSAEVFELDPRDLDCPVLCLAGPERGNFHPDGCPHATAWKLWGDVVSA